jgi:class 3 adenylate cyclase
MSVRRSATPALWAAAAALAVLAAYLLAARVERLQGLDRFEWALLDLRMRMGARYTGEEPASLAFVFADDATVRNFSAGLLDGEPIGLLWPRQIYGRLARELAAQGARATAFDVVLSELRPDHKDVTLPDGRTVSSDGAFAEAMREAGNVVLAATPEVPPAALFLTNALAIGDIAVERDADGVGRRFHVFRTYRIWNPVLFEFALRNGLRWEPSSTTNRIHMLDPATGEAVRDLEIDDTGKFSFDALLGRAPRGFVRLAPAYETRRVWNLGVVLAAAQLGVNLDDAGVDLERGRVVLRGTNGLERVIPVDARGRMYADWTVPVEDPRLLIGNFESVLLDAQRRAAGLAGATNRYQGRLVVVGSAATSSNLSDIGATPLGESTFQASGLWNIAQTIISGRFIRPAPPWLGALLVLVAAVVGFVVTRRLSAAGAVLVVLAAAAAYVAAAWWLFLALRWWVPVVFPLGGLLLVHGVALAVQVALERGERQRVRAVFARMVSPEVVKELLGSERLALGGARRRLTVFFADVRGFTELTDTAEARALAQAGEQGLAAPDTQALLAQQAEFVLATVNLYLATVADLVKRHGGTLDKYIGDCVMAFWGAPTDDPEHALNCVRAAIEAQRAIADLNRRREVEAAARGEPTPPLLQLGTGINTGLATAGLVGSDQHILNYTVFGREVNLASRLESASGRARILISAATLEELRISDPALAAACVPLPAVTMKGFREPVPVFEVPWRRPEDGTPQAPDTGALAAGPAAVAR